MTNLCTSCGLTTSYRLAQNIRESQPAPAVHASSYGRPILLSAAISVSIKTRMNLCAAPGEQVALAIS